jgi:hypothetical protein
VRAVLERRRWFQSYDEESATVSASMLNSHHAKRIATDDACCDRSAIGTVWSMTETKTIVRPVTSRRIASGSGCDVAPGTSRSISALNPPERGIGTP